MFKFFFCLFFALQLTKSSGAIDFGEILKDPSSILDKIPIIKDIESIMNTNKSRVDKVGILCYPKCKDGYVGVGPICWRSCKISYDTNTTDTTVNFKDHGLFCYKAKTYGRGVGYPWKIGDPFDLKLAMKRCEKDNGAGNCERNGLIIYPKCKENYYSFGCCICTQKCPDKMTDIGISCAKDAYGRGFGKLCFN